MSDVKDPLHIAELLKLDIADSETEKLFSTFTSIFSLHHDHWLQKRFSIHNSSFVLTLSSDKWGANTDNHSLICLLQWQHDGNSWSEQNELSKSLFERLGKWVETYNLESAQVEFDPAPIPSTGKNTAMTIKIKFLKAVHNDTIRGEFQDFVENVCSYLTPFSIVEEEE